jgi:hypothetical protein
METPQLGSDNQGTDYDYDYDYDYFSQNPISFLKTNREGFPPKKIWRQTQVILL